MFQNFKYTLSFRIIAIVVMTAFLGMIPLESGYAQVVLQMPAAGQMIHVTPRFNPPQMAGIRVDLKDPFHFYFVMDQGQRPMGEDVKRAEYEKLIKYFLSSLTIPNNDMWVNLSPHESNRIMPDNFAETEMGRDLLAQDYVLKQLSSSLMYPEDDLGKKFWAKVYAQAQEKYGTTDIPVDTFNKVWITADKADIFQKDDTAFIVDSHLKVMLEQDFMAMTQNREQFGNVDPAEEGANPETRKIASDIIRELIVPIIEKEVNEGESFALVRQVYSAMILATWFKRTLKQSLLNQVYTDRNKVSGIEVNDPQAKDKIYQQYLDAYKVGVFNYIKEDVDPITQEVLPRKYFSGGNNMAMAVESAMQVNPQGERTAKRAAAKAKGKEAVEATLGQRMVNGAKRVLSFGLWKPKASAPVQTAQSATGTDKAPAPAPAAQKARLSDDILQKTLSAVNDYEATSQGKPTSLQDKKTKLLELFNNDQAQIEAALQEVAEVLRQQAEAYGKLTTKTKDQEEFIQEAPRQIKKVEDFLGFLKKPATETKGYPALSAEEKQGRQEAFKAAVHAQILDAHQMGQALTEEQVAALKDAAKKEGLATDEDLQAALDDAIAALRAGRDALISTRTQLKQDTQKNVEAIKDAERRLDALENELDKLLKVQDALAGNETGRSGVNSALTYEDLVNMNEVLRSLQYDGSLTGDAVLKVLEDIRKITDRKTAIDLLQKLWNTLAGQFKEEGPDRQEKYRFYFGEMERILGDLGVSVANPMPAAAPVAQVAGAGTLGQMIEEAVNADQGPESDVKKVLEAGRPSAEEIEKRYGELANKFEQLPQDIEALEQNIAEKYEALLGNPANAGEISAEITVLEDQVAQKEQELKKVAREVEQIARLVTTHQEGMRLPYLLAQVRTVLGQEQQNQRRLQAQQEARQAAVRLEERQPKRNTRRLEDRRKERTGTARKVQNSQKRINSLTRPLGTTSPTPDALVKWFESVHQQVTDLQKKIETAREARRVNNRTLREIERNKKKGARTTAEETRLADANQKLTDDILAWGKEIQAIPNYEDYMYILGEAQKIPAVLPSPGAVSAPETTARPNVRVNAGAPGTAATSVGRQQENLNQAVGGATTSSAGSAARPGDGSSAEEGTDVTEGAEKDQGTPVTLGDAERKLQARLTAIVRDADVAAGKIKARTPQAAAQRGQEKRKAKVATDFLEALTSGQMTIDQVQAGIAKLLERRNLRKADREVLEAVQRSIRSIKAVETRAKNAKAKLEAQQKAAEARKLRQEAKDKAVLDFLTKRVAINWTDVSAGKVTANDVIAILKAVGCNVVTVKADAKTEAWVVVLNSLPADMPWAVVREAFARLGMNIVGDSQTARLNMTLKFSANQAKNKAWETLKAPQTGEAVKKTLAAEGVEVDDVKPVQIRINGQDVAAWSAVCPVFQKTGQLSKVQKSLPDIVTVQEEIQGGKPTGRLIFSWRTEDELTAAVQAEKDARKKDAADRMREAQTRLRQEARQKREHLENAGYVLERLLTSSSDSDTQMGLELLAELMKAPQERIRDLSAAKEAFGRLIDSLTREDLGVPIGVNQLAENARKEIIARKKEERKKAVSSAIDYVFTLRAREFLSALISLIRAMKEEVAKAPQDEREALTAKINFLEDVLGQFRSVRPSNRANAATHARRVAASLRLSVEKDLGLDSDESLEAVRQDIEAALKEQRDLHSKFIGQDPVRAGAVAGRIKALQQALGDLQNLKVWLDQDISPRAEDKPEEVGYKEGVRFVAEIRNKNMVAVEEAVQSISLEDMKNLNDANRKKIRSRNRNAEGFDMFWGLAPAQKERFLKWMAAKLEAEWFSRPVSEGADMKKELEALKQKQAALENALAAVAEAEAAKKKAPAPSSWQMRRDRMKAAWKHLVTRRDGALKAKIQEMIGRARARRDKNYSIGMNVRIRVLEQANGDNKTLEELGAWLAGQKTKASEEARRKEAEKKYSGEDLEEYLDAYKQALTDLTKLFNNFPSMATAPSSVPPAVSAAPGVPAPTTPVTPVRAAPQGSVWAKFRRTVNSGVEDLRLWLTAPSFNRVIKPAVQNLSAPGDVTGHAVVGWSRAVSEAQGILASMSLRGFKQWLEARSTRSQVPQDAVDAFQQTLGPGASRGADTAEFRDGYVKAIEAMAEIVSPRAAAREPAQALELNREPAMKAEPSEQTEEKVIVAFTGKVKVLGEAAKGPVNEAFALPVGVGRDKAIAKATARARVFDSIGQLLLTADNLNDIERQLSQIAPRPEDQDALLDERQAGINEAKQKLQEELDSAKRTYGGINLSEENLTINIKVDGEGMPLPAQFQDPAMINIDGLSPIIREISPVNAVNMPILSQLMETAGASA